MAEITVYHLEMLNRSQFCEKTDSNGLHVIEAEVKHFPLNRFLYQYVGAQWKWFDKLKWPEDEWKAYAESEILRTWIGYHRGSPAGYFELQQQENASVEIMYFGLAPGFIGHGFGGYLLSQAIRAAWDWDGTDRVWVHTCSLDHPNALNNYKARGFEVFKTEQITNAEVG